MTADVVGLMEVLNTAKKNHERDVSNIDIVLQCLANCRENNHFARL